MNWNEEEIYVVPPEDRAGWSDLYHMLRNYPHHYGWIRRFDSRDVRLTPCELHRAFQAIRDTGTYQGSPVICVTDDEVGVALGELAATDGKIVCYLNLDIGAITRKRPLKDLLRDQAAQRFDPWVKRFTNAPGFATLIAGTRYCTLDDWLKWQKYGVRQMLAAMRHCGLMLARTGFFLVRADGVRFARLDGMKESEAQELHLPAVPSSPAAGVPPAEPTGTTADVTPPAPKAVTPPAPCSVALPVRGASLRGPRPPGTTSNCATTTKPGGAM